jgi:hypothetical protein
MLGSVDSRSEGVVKGDCERHGPLCALKSLALNLPQLLA